MELLKLLLPELILVVTACGLFLLGISNKATARRMAPVFALLALVVVIGLQLSRATDSYALIDRYGTLRVSEFTHYFKLLVAVVGVMLVLLAWPTNADATGGTAIDFGHDAAEFFALMLLSLAGVFLVAGANDIILLFLGIELASLPTYIMVSVSRPLPVAQEAGVKYFFLGALAAAVMLFGFSYLYGTTGQIRLDQISATLLSHQHAGQPTELSSWQLMAVIMLIGGFAFKIAAVPFHVYAGDVYQGAATPVTAFLAFVPKTSGFIALIKLVYALGGDFWTTPPTVVRLLWVLAVLTMTFGNCLGLLQFNIKRVLAYSSIAHSGYMLVALTALASGPRDNSSAGQALQAILFYLAAYGITNTAAFAVLMMLPSRDPSRPATSAETFDDLAGQGRRYVGRGLVMAVACFSLTGLPFTVGFWGKYFIIRPALIAHLYWLAAITMINAAISAAYYLRIVATLFLRPEPQTSAGSVAPARFPIPLPIGIAAALSVAGALVLGICPPATQLVNNRVVQGADMGIVRPASPTPAVAQAR